MARTFIPIPQMWPKITPLTQACTWDKGWQEHPTKYPILDIVHRPVFQLKHSISETGFCLHLQVEPTQLVPIDRAGLCLRIGPEAESTPIYWALLSRFHLKTEIEAVDLLGQIYYYLKLQSLVFEYKLCNFSNCDGILTNLAEKVSDICIPNRLHGDTTHASSIFLCTLNLCTCVALGQTNLTTG
jgi:hypothetical protein